MKQSLVSSMSKYKEINLEECADNFFSKHIRVIDFLFSKLSIESNLSFELSRIIFCFLID